MKVLHPNLNRKQDTEGFTDNIKDTTMDKNLEPAMSARIATLLYLLPEEGQKINFLGKIPLDDIIKADPISSTDIQSITNVGDGKFAVQDAYFDIPFEELTGEQQELMVAKALIWSNDNMKKNGAIISMVNALDDCRAILGNEFPLHKVFLYTQILDGTLLTKVAYNEENNKYFAKDDEGDAYDLTEVDSDTAIKIAGKAYISVLHQQLGDEGRITLNKPFKIWDSNGNPYTIKEIEEDKYGEGIALTGDYTEKNGKVFENEYISGNEILSSFSVSEMKKLADHIMENARQRSQSMETPGLTATENAVVYSVFKNVFQNLPEHYDIADVKEVAKGVNPHPERIDNEELAGIVEEMLNVNSLVVQNKNLTDRQQSILKIESTIVGGSQKMAEFLKPEINTHDSLEFDGQKWPLRSIVLPHTGENVLIGTEALEQALHPDEWNGRKAQAIYERIFYYVSDKDLQQPAAKLAAQVEKEALGLGDTISLNGEKLEVGMKVIWNDPDESARDLSRVWTIDNINGEVISISDGYSEAEVTANELTTYKGELQEKTQEESNGQHAKMDDVILRANELGLDFHPVGLKGDVFVKNIDDGAEYVDKTFSYATVKGDEIVLFEKLYDVFDQNEGYYLSGIPEESKNEILDKLFDSFFAENDQMVVVYDKQEVPSYALSAILNGDFSGIEDEEDEKDIRAFIEKNSGYILDVDPNSAGFTRNPAFGLPTDCETMFMVKPISPSELLEEKKAQVIKEPEETLPLTPEGDKIDVGVKVTWQDPDVENRDLSRVWQVDKINGEVISISDGYSEAEVTANELNVVNADKRSYDEVFKEAESLLQKFLPNYGDGMNFKPDDAPEVTRDSCAAFIANTGDTVNVIHDYSDQFSFSDVSKTEGQKIYEIVPVMSVFQQSDLEKYITAMKEHGDEAVELYNLRKEVIDDLKERVIDSSGYSFSPEAVQRIRNYSKAMIEGQEKGEYGMAIIDSIKDIVWKDPEVARKPDKWFTDAAKEFDSIVNGDDLSNQMRTHFHR